MPKFIAEWEFHYHDNKYRAWAVPADKWYALPVGYRADPSRNCYEFCARDELEAFTEVLKLEEQLNNDS